MAAAAEALSGLGGDEETMKIAERKGESSASLRLRSLTYI